MRPAELRVPVEGGHLAVRDHGGTGRHVVLVHEVCDNSAQWDNLAPLLAQHAHVVSIDLRGHGQTTAAMGDLGQVARDFAALADHLGGSLVLVGHHWGGDICAYVADELPHLIDALCVIDSPISLSAGEARELVDYVAQKPVLDTVVSRLALGRTGLGPVQLGNFIDATAAVVANDWINPPMTAEEALTLITRSIHHGPGILWTRVPTRETLEAYTRHSTRRRFSLDHFTDQPWPVWILQPTDGDYPSNAPALQELVTGRPGWAMRHLPGGAHCWYTHPEAVCNTLARLLDDLPATA